MRELLYLAGGRIAGPWMIRQFFCHSYYIYPDGQRS